VASLDDEIRYYDREFWEKLRVDLYELYKCTQRILTFYEALTKRISQRASGDYELLKILVGGFDVEKCVFEERALGAFYNAVYGVGVKDLHKLCTMLKTVDVEKALEHAGVGVRETAFLAHVKAIHSLLKPLFKPVEESIDVSAEAGFSLVEEFLNKARRLLPLYNKATFFIQSLGSGLPRYYAEVVYPKLFNEEAKVALREVGAEVEVRYVPNIPDETWRQRYAIVGLTKTSEMYKVYKLIPTIYRLFSGYPSDAPFYALRSYFQLEDEAKKYYDLYMGKVRGALTDKESENLLWRLRLTPAWDPEGVYRDAFQECYTEARRAYKVLPDCSPSETCHRRLATVGGWAVPLDNLASGVGYHRVFQVLSPLTLSGLAAVDENGGVVTIYGLFFAHD